MLSVSREPFSSHRRWYMHMLPEIKPSKEDQVPGSASLALGFAKFWNSEGASPRRESSRTGRTVVLSLTS